MRSLLYIICGLLLLLAAGSAHAQVGCVPNPNLTPASNVPPGYVNGCSLPAAALNSPFFAGTVTVGTATGTPLCVNDALTTGPYHQLCFGANSQGGGMISYNPFGGAANLPMQFNVNGVNYPFPPAGNGNVLGPASPPTIIPDVACWNATNGTVLMDCATITSNGPSKNPQVHTWGSLFNADRSCITGGASGCFGGTINNSDVVQVQAMAGPTTAAGLQVDGVAVYHRNQVANNPANNNLPDAVGIFSVATCEVANCNSFAMNVQAQDYWGAGYPTTFTGGIIHDIEADLLVGNTHTIASAYTAAGVAYVNPLIAHAYYCNAWANPNSLVTPPTWTECFRSDHGVTATFAEIGARASGGTNSSQQILFDVFAAGTAHQYALQASENFNIPSMMLTSNFTDWNVAINTGQPVDNSGTGHSGVSVAGSIGGVLSLMGGSTEYLRLIGHSSAGGQAIIETVNATPILIETNNVSAMSIDTVQNVFVASATATAANSSNPFLQITTTTGLPTGTPNSTLGQSAITVDSTDHKFCWYEKAGSRWYCAQGS